MREKKRTTDSSTEFILNCTKQKLLWSMNRFSYLFYLFFHHIHEFMATALATPSFPFSLILVLFFRISWQPPKLLKLWTWDKSTVKSVLGCIVTVNGVTDPLLPLHQRHTHTHLKWLQAGHDGQSSSRWERNSWYMMIDRVTDRRLSPVPISQYGLTMTFLWSWRKQ